ncbi:MAG: UDP-N-acetylmuramate dehydrogenase [Fimbriimonadaceae bacterium]|jgi:UDP-N-acetylmuramate dehydrogenase|nr:UDP-N-acetylmuramate dehydrogenase [Fimbriimonadaceae bacterium]
MQEIQIDPSRFERGRSLALFTTLKAGGPAELFCECATADDLAAVAQYAQTQDLRLTILGWGSNILPSDTGISGLVVVNGGSDIVIEPDGVVTADSGCSFQELFLKTVQAGLKGLEFAVGIPGSLGGALVSNAGAYRSNVSEFLTEIEVVENGVREWRTPAFMGFHYRDSVLRSETPPQIALIRVRLKLPRGDAKASYDEARDYQRQRIGKQPPSASAGSFFKNIYDQKLADSLDNLPERLKSAGVVPAGYLIEKVGLKGFRYEGAMLGARHANFLLNVGGAKASSLRRLAEYAKRRVEETYGVRLEEEVLYIGDWLNWVSTGELPAS